MSKPISEAFLRKIGFEDDPSDSYDLRFRLKTDGPYPSFLSCARDFNDKHNGHQIAFCSYDSGKEQDFPDDIIIVSPKDAMMTEADMIALLRCLRQEIPL